jgi:RNA-binding motif protein, X-linked 2
VACELSSATCIPDHNHEVRLIRLLLRKPSLIYSFIYHSVVREINKINERELELGVGTASWHDEYKGRTMTNTITLLEAHKVTDSAYIFIGGLHYGLTEGDVITIFSQ